MCEFARSIHPLIHFCSFFVSRDKIIKTLKCLYGLHTKKNLPIYDIQEQNLRGYTTTEKNKKQSVDKFPPEDFRNYAEDLIPEEKKAVEPAKPKDLDTRMLDGEDFMRAKVEEKYFPKDQDDDKGSDDEEEQIKATMQGAANMNPGHAETEF